MLEHGRQLASLTEFGLVAHRWQNDLREPQRAAVGPPDAGRTGEGCGLLVLSQGIQRLPGQLDHRRHDIARACAINQGRDVFGRRKRRIALEVDDEVGLGRRQLGRGAAAVRA